MEIGPINPLSISAPVNTTTTTQDNTSFVRQLVTAIRGLNKSELMGQGKELSFTRDPETQRPVIQILDSDTGEVIDQIPPETVLRLASGLEQKTAKGDS